MDETFVFTARSPKSAVCSFIQWNINPLSDLTPMHFLDDFSWKCNFHPQFTFYNTSSANQGHFNGRASFKSILPLWSMFLGGKINFFCVFFKNFVPRSVQGFEALTKFRRGLVKSCLDQLWSTVLTEFQSLSSLRCDGSSSSMWVINSICHKNVKY